MHPPSVICFVNAASGFPLLSFSRYLFWAIQCQAGYWAVAIPAGLYNHLLFLLDASLRCLRIFYEYVFLLHHGSIAINRSFVF